LLPIQDRLGDVQAPVCAPGPRPRQSPGWPARLSGHALADRLLQLVMAQAERGGAVVRQRQGPRLDRVPLVGGFDREETAAGLGPRGPAGRAPIQLQRPLLSRAWTPPDQVDAE
jgi:hypothetical protein